MLELTVLTTFAVILAIFTLWTIRTTKKVGKALYQAFLPSSRGNVKDDSKPEPLTALSDQLTAIRMPWGWRDAPRTIAAPLPIPASVLATGAPIPWGWPGSHSYMANGNGSFSIRDWAERVRTSTQSAEIPFARDRNVVTVRLRALSTYFSENEQLVLRDADSDRDRGFQLPWGW